VTELLKNKGTLPCDRCGCWTILKPYDNRLLLCDDCIPKQAEGDSTRFEIIQLNIDEEIRNHGK